MNPDLIPQAAGLTISIDSIAIGVILAEVSRFVLAFLKARDNGRRLGKLEDAVARLETSMQGRGLIRQPSAPNEIIRDGSAE